MSDTEKLFDQVQTCKRHGCYASKGEKTIILGEERIWWSPCPECVEEHQAYLVDMERRRLEEIEDKRLGALASRGLKGRLIGMTFEAYRADTEEQARALSKCREFAAAKDGTLVLVGGVGTGKTHLGAAMALATGGDYTTLMRMIRNIRETYRSDCKDTEQDRIDSWAEARFLVLDEVGVQHCTDAEQLLAYEVINERYVENLPTVLISNETVEGMGKILGERVMDRLAEKGQVVAFTWASYRRAKHE